MTTRDEVLREFTENWDGIEVLSYKRIADQIVRLRDERESVSSQLHDAENERDGLRSRLATVEAERDIMKGYYEDAVKVGIECVEKMRLAERILAALREPSEAVVYRMVQRTIEGLHHVDVDVVLDAIRVALPAAVAAAEREVGT